MPPLPQSMVLSARAAEYTDSIFAEECDPHPCLDMTLNNLMVKPFNDMKKKKKSA